jgi:adenylate cyclase
VAQGFPLLRVGLSLGDVHPQLAARTYSWRRGQPIEEIERHLAASNTDTYLLSPVRVIREGADALRRRLDRGPEQLDFPILTELKAAGATDYVAMALRFADGSRHFLSWATDRPGGFTSAQLAELYDLLPLIGLRIELDHARAVTQTLLTTYLGRDAAKRISRGTIRRGEAERIDAIIMFSDVRGFTRLADTLPPEDAVAVLSAYYDAVAGAVKDFGGDIVKLLGDGLLAIYPLTPEAGEERVGKARVDHVACGAVAAVRRARQALEDMTPADLPDGAWPLRAGFALHAGPVIFGNVGSSDRLDFTVVGPAVNEVTRVEELTKSLGFPVLVTEAFAALECPTPLTSLGFHALRGVSEPKELFTLAPTASTDG